jgi:hypothetical protein
LKTVKDYVTACDICSRSEVPCHHPYGLLCPLPIPKKPWSLISINFIIDLPSSKAFDSIFVVVDQLTKMAHFMPCNKMVICEETTRLFMDKITSTMAFLMTSSPIVVHSSPLSFGNHYSRSLRPRSSYLPHIILKLMDKQKRLIKSRNNIYIVISTTIKTIGQNCYHLLSLCTTIPFKDLFSRSHSLPTMGTIQSLISSTSTKWKIQ